ncbi:UDP-2,3-diacylglucosamine diphosphatase [Desulfuromonas sp. AOP6]|uniref:UDP-2,3-diacylglucosamine diphosphatase n=1 Tax=Desulfuromonas sp. AOP6 TaxID=1566351 RepID=UPI0012798524|nr:UDP-2,3-diacylglucosamine diphosphatase [Desulfuromonas sp. AOP6]BCA79437.1 UDP-2,3-diacylglucosamine hydrolase [Desulfuromonas sp. AOP6]
MEPDPCRPLDFAFHAHYSRPMKDIFLADAHLLNPADSNYQRLLHFLESEGAGIRTLYLLGDIFEFWVGYRSVVFSPYVPLLEALRRLRGQGVEIVYVEGNHDFNLGPYFRNELSCHILPDGGSITIDGIKVYIGHGDLVNQEDKGYRLLRRFLRSRFLTFLMAIVPPDLTWAISRWGSRRSKERRGGKQGHHLPEQALRRHANHLFVEGHQAVITGHFHTPLFDSSAEGTLIALGDWITQYSYAVYEDGAFSLRTF